MRNLSLFSFVCLMFLATGSLFAAETVDPGWPEFRGPLGDGHGVASGLAQEWSETENVKWKTELANKGWSSPVVLDGKVWVTAATTKGNDFFAIGLDVATGKIEHNLKLFHSDDPEPLGNSVNCYAAPSAVAEPGRVYIHFGSYGTACLDSKTGKLIWERKDLECQHYRGPGSSPIMFENLLVLTFDGVDVQYVVALDKMTGKTVWKTDRTTDFQDLDENGVPKREGDFRKAFSTPLIIDVAGKPQLLSVASKVVYSYEPLTGKEIWHVLLPGYTTAPRPVFANGIAYVGTGHGDTQIWEVRTDGLGDVTKSHVGWKFSGRNAPTIPSQVLVDGLLYVIANNGIATCLDVATGKEVWSERLGGNYLASPIYADGRLYFCSQQGKTSVVKPGRKYELLASNKLDSGFLASPSAVGKSLFLRTKTHLYCVELGAK